jgi:hypothetical protein
LSIRAIADNWANTIAFWSLLPLSVLVIAFMVMACAPDKLIWGLLCTPVFAVPLAVVVYVLFLPVGLLAGAIISGQSADGRKYKTVIRVVE